MIALYPLVLGVALWRASTARGGATGWPWFLAWSIAGSLFTFSFLAGFSIGLFVLPIAALALLWVAGRSGGHEVLGVLQGAGWILLTVATLNNSAAWLVAGAACSAGALAAYTLLAPRRPPRLGPS